MKPSHIKALAILLCVCLLFAGATVSATVETLREPTSTEAPVPSVPEISLPVLNRCSAGGVCNGETGEMLFSSNENKKVFPAATVKLMTALLALEHYSGKLDAVISVTEPMLQDVSGVTVDLRAGEALTVRQLLACLVVGSANDAALVLARSISGTVEDFVARMNRKAAELKMESTVYHNPTGMHHKDMVTTVSDTLKLAVVLYRNAEFMNLCGRETFEIPANQAHGKRLIHNRNYLVSNRLTPDYYDPDVNGMNYGSTYEAGGCVVASTEVDGAIHIAAVFGGQSETVVTNPEETDSEDASSIETKVVAHAFHEVKSLIAWAKKSFTYYLVAGTSDVICEIPVRLGDGREHVALFPAEPVELYLPADLNPAKDIRTECTLYENALTAPVMAGVIAGTYSVYYLGELVAQVELTTRSTVDRSIWGYYAERAADFIRSETFRKGALIGLGVLILYALCMSVWRYQARKKALLRRRREREEEQRAREREKLNEWK